jgi:hypothetical protein
MYKKKKRKTLLSSSAAVAAASTPNLQSEEKLKEPQSFWRMNNKVATIMKTR